MVLKELQIDSFGRFRGRNILLSEGMNILYGGNASGKSTVRDYILFVFFGKEAEKWMQTSSLDNYLPRPSGLMEGQIRFSFEGKEYRAMRVYGNGKQAFAVLELPSGADALRGGSRIGDLIPGLTPEDFANDITIPASGDVQEEDPVSGWEKEKQELLDQIRMLQKQQALVQGEEYEEKKKAASLIEENNTITQSYREKKAQLAALQEQEKKRPRAAGVTDAIRKYEDLRVEYEDLVFTQQELDAQAGGGALKATAFAFPLLAIAVAVFLAGGALGIPESIRALASLAIVLIAFLVFLLVLARAAGKKSRIKQLEKKANSAAHKMQDILNTYGVSSREELMGMKNRTPASPEILKLEEEMASLEKRYKQLQIPLKPYLEKYGDTIVLDEDEDRDQAKQIAELKENLQQVQRRIEAYRKGGASKGSCTVPAVPLVLDGYFSSFDDDRLSATLAWLSRQEIFSQTLILTCHRREQEALSGLGIPFTYQELP